MSNKKVPRIRIGRNFFYPLSSSLSLEFPNYSFEKTESCALCRRKTSQIISFQIDKRGKSYPNSVLAKLPLPQNPPRNCAVYSSGSPVQLCWGVWVSVCGYLASPGWWCGALNNTESLWPDHRQAAHHHHHPWSAFALWQQLDEIMTRDIISCKTTPTGQGRKTSTRSWWKDLAEHHHHP